MYLRCPVSGSVSTAEAGQLSFMVSGPKSTFDAVLPVLSAFSQKQLYLETANRRGI
jgi:3-hydroxyisobutyrate dehydrogenase-like beta-hydroxyacid dehydrogenase